MTRIKSSSVHLGDSFVIGKSTSSKKDADVQALEDEAEKLMANAAKQAQSIIAEANRQAEELSAQVQQEAFQNGHASGHQAGYQEGVAKFQEEFAYQLKYLQVIADAASAVKKKIISEAEPEIVELCILLAEKMVKQQLIIDKDSIASIVKAAINELKEKDEVKLLLNPKVAKYLKESQGVIKQELDSVESIKIVEDKTVSPDGAIVESNGARIDARLATQIEVITKKLMEEALESAAKEEISQEVEEKIEKEVKKATKGKKNG